MVPGRVQGKVIEVDGESLVIDVDGATEHSRVLRQAITRLDVSMGQRRYTKRGALIGGASGVGSGIVVGLGGDYRGDELICNRKATCAVAFGITGATWALPGAVIGVLFKGERWTELAPYRRTP